MSDNNQFFVIQMSVDNGNEAATRLYKYGAGIMALPNSGYDDYVTDCFDCTRYPTEETALLAVAKLVRTLGHPVSAKPIMGILRDPPVEHELHGQVAHRVTFKVVMVSIDDWTTLHKEEVEVVELALWKTGQAEYQTVLLPG